MNGKRNEKMVDDDDDEMVDGWDNDVKNDVKNGG